MNNFSKNEWASAAGAIGKNFDNKDVIKKKSKNDATTKIPPNKAYKL